MTKAESDLMVQVQWYGLVLTSISYCTLMSKYQLMDVLYIED